MTKHQTFWEFATLLLSLLVWGNRFVSDSVMVVGDNTGALDNALSLKGKGELIAISRELSWRQAKRGWLFSVGHLPSEFNVVADALSRQGSPRVISGLSSRSLQPFQWRRPDWRAYGWLALVETVTDTCLFQLFLYHTFTHVNGESVGGRSRVYHTAGQWPAVCYPHGDRHRRHVWFHSRFLTRSSSLPSGFCA